jgi:acetyl-CoA carboxylase/biotin carboxylase 1
LLSGCKHPKDAEIFQCIELVLDSEEAKVVERKRYPGENSIAMVAWRMTMKTPEYPDGNFSFTFTITFEAA